MKKTKIALTIFVTALLISASIFVGGAGALATSTPSLSLNSVSGSGSIQVTVYGATPNSSVLLYYPASSSFSSINIGTTNASGYLTTTINSATYGIAAKAQVYVGVNGASSQQSTWPDYYNVGGLTLSQTIANITAGQSTTISAQVSATLSMSNNSNPSVASAAISGNQITINGLSAGTSNITICAANIGCGIVYVTVQAASTNTSPLTLSQSTVNLTIGQGTTVAISGGSGAYYINTNSNAAVASANMSGTTLNINAIMAGSAIIGVCTQGSISTSCTSVNVTVTGSSINNNSLATQQNQKLTFNQSEVTLSIGQKQSVAIYGGLSSGVYYIQNNSTPSSVTANVNGSNVDLTGVAMGGANINICQVGGVCGSVYAFVPDNNVTAATTATGSTAATSVASTNAPALASFSVASNNTSGSFFGSGNVLTFSMTTNQVISTPTILVSGTTLSVSGSGNGPYTATYTLSDNRSALPVSITFNNPAGTSGQAKFTLGEASAVSASSVASVVTAAVTKITQYLKVGSTGAEVTALQKRLKALGVYTGAITGTFGAQTEAAVKKLQAKYKLSQLGVVGPATRAVLNQ